MFCLLCAFSYKTSTHWEGRSMSRTKQCLAWFYDGWSRSQRFVNLVGNYSYVSSSVNLEANLWVNNEQIYRPNGVVRFSTDFAKQQISIFFFYLAYSLGRFTDSSPVASLWALVASCVLCWTVFPRRGIPAAFAACQWRLSRRFLTFWPVFILELLSVLCFYFDRVDAFLWVVPQIKSLFLYSVALSRLINSGTSWSFSDNVWSCMSSTIRSLIISSFRVP